MKKYIRRGNIYYADLNPVTGSEQGGIRPVLILQNNIGNRNSPTTIIAAITGRSIKSPLPTHVELSTAPGLPKNSTVLTEQIRTIDEKRLRGFVCTLDAKQINAADRALAVSVGLEKNAAKRKRAEIMNLCPFCEGQILALPGSRVIRLGTAEMPGVYCDYCGLRPGAESVVISENLKSIV